MDYEFHTATRAVQLSSMALGSVSSAAPSHADNRPNRTRQWHTKTRTGCLTCKGRRVKCGEERPSCTRCLSAGRECSYEIQPKARIFETSSQSPVSASTLELVKPRDYGTSNPEEVRALQYFLEVTAPAASTYNEHTKEFFEYLIPQVAQSEAAVRHLAVAIAARQESMASSTDTAVTLARVQTKHYVAGLNALSQGRASSEDVILLASALFITLGQLETLEDQRAQGLFHLVAGLKILIERLDVKKPSHIIDTYIHPIFARMESMMSIFMLPLDSEAILCTVEPEEPVLPTQFSDLEEARKAWCAIVCWRYREVARSQPWTSESEYFQEVRGLLLKWNHLLMAYAGKAALGSPQELQRAIAMISEFRFLFIGMMFSVRYDLHIQDQVRPSFINLIVPGEVSITYNYPKRTLDMLPELDWEVDEFYDPLKVRLWPVVDAVKRTENAGIVRMTFTERLT